MHKKQVVVGKIYSQPIDLGGGLTWVIDHVPEVCEILRIFKS